MFVILNVGLNDHSPKSPGGHLAPGPQIPLLICGKTQQFPPLRMWAASTVKMGSALNMILAE